MDAAQRENLAKAAQLLLEALALVEGARDAEESAYDAMPEALRASSKGRLSADRLDTLSNAAWDLEKVSAVLGSEVRISSAMETL